ncbi:hypothetical protein, variant [Aphanomyces astaci]|uniref:Inositol polyphosphate-related phosphatase domain-containing protein n=1 Tax=Aphanomyces astaci TaxID=112090 RepID=W4GQZ6_APHAT|nr:hypothetical protein, variant [Aphanomyces astaci]ETV81313.1 hypothetical protein, variant [Aphanomyces astaci]|eukprot:XP_009829171.1 hypothetical protein, variant [Aphanomyces astaci]
MSGKRAWQQKFGVGETERLAIDWSVRSTSILSTLGCAYILVRCTFFQSNRRDVSRLLVMTLAAIQLVVSVVKLPALQFASLQKRFKRGDSDGMLRPYFLVNATADDSSTSSAVFCQIQAYLLDVFMLQAVLWNACMAYNLLRWVVYRDSEEKLQSRFWVYFFGTSVFCVVWGFTGALPVWSYQNNPQVSSLFGFSRFYCWMKFPDYILYRFVPFVVLTLLFMVAVVIKVRKVVAVRARRLSMTPSVADPVATKIQRTLLYYVVGFLCLYTLPTAYRFLEAAMENKDEATSNGWSRGGSGNGSSKSPNSEWTRNATAHSQGGEHSTFMQVFAVVSEVLVNLQGFVIAVIFHRCSVSRRCKSQSSSSGEGSSLEPDACMDDARSCASKSEAVYMCGASGRIFASTFNMAEGAVPPPEQLERWIPKGHDIYVIGVQECIDLRTMRHVMASHLQRINGKTYIEYGREIGRTETLLGYHGFIAITVYVAADDVHAGHFHMHLDATSKVNRGKNLIGLGRASNKGAVGFAFRYFNVTFAVLTCHLASDSTGKSKIKKRHHDGASILTNMHLQSIENEFDCHLMAHHTIFMGDLNYRLTALDATPDRILHMITDVINTSRRRHESKRVDVCRDMFLASSPSSSQYSMSVPGNPELKDYASEVSSGDTDVYLLTESPSAVLGNGFSMERAAAARGVMTPHHLGHPNVESPYSMASSSAFSPVLQSWQSLFLHDELKQSMADGVILSDFEEAKIAFPPTYRRVLDQMLDVRQPTTVAQVAALYTTVLGEGRVRVPSYTDRILFHSLPGLRDRFTCVQYTSAEYIGTSDHKPVSCVFDVLVDKAAAVVSPRPVPRRLLAGGHPPHNVVYGVQLTQLNVRWGPTLEDFETSDESDGGNLSNKCAQDSFSSDLSQATTASGTIQPGMIFEGLRVRSVFPLPCEDPFAEERKLVEVADNLLFSSGQGTGTTLKPTWKLNAWPALLQHGLRHSAVLPLRKPLHLAMNFILPSGTTAGQCVVSLTQASHRPSRKLDFVATISVGGRRTGELTGKATLSIDMAP